LLHRKQATLHDTQTMNCNDDHTNCREYCTTYILKYIT